jgi:hypothetical protein
MPEPWIGSWRERVHCPHPSSPASASAFRISLSHHRYGSRTFQQSLWQRPRPEFYTIAPAIAFQGASSPSPFFSQRRLKLTNRGSIHSENATRVSEAIWRPLRLPSASSPRDPGDDSNGISLRSESPPQHHSPHQLISSAPGCNAPPSMALSSLFQVAEGSRLGTPEPAPPGVNQR